MSSVLAPTAVRPSCSSAGAQRRPSCCSMRVPSARPQRSVLGGQHQQQQQPRLGVRVSAASSMYGALEKNTDAPLEGYLAVGLAHCFEKDEDGKLKDLFLIEPLSAPALECMVNGSSTCFMHVVGTTVAEALKQDKSTLPAEFAEGSWCDDYSNRVGYAARTWLRSHPQDNLLDIVPLGKLRSNFNIDLSRKRVLNMEHVVSDADNIKQDMSIDVYGRKDEEEEAEEAADEDDDGDLDSLLAA